MTDASQLEEIRQSLTSRQLSFVAARLFCASDKAAAEKIGISASAVYNWSNKKAVDEAIRLSRLNAIPVATAYLESLVTEAIRVIHDTALGNNPKLALVAACEILDRSGLVKGTALDITSKGEQLGAACTPSEQLVLIRALMAQSQGAEEHGE